MPDDHPPQGCREGGRGTDGSLTPSALTRYFCLFSVAAGEKQSRGLLSKRGLGSPPSVYLKNAGNGESEAGRSGNQEELGETQTKGQNPAKEEAPEYPQEQPCVLETEDFLRCRQMETWKQGGERGDQVLGVPAGRLHPPAAGRSATAAGHTP